MSEPAQVLPWDTAHFGHTIGRFTGDEITTPTMAELISWMANNHVECVYVLANASDSPGIHAVEEVGGRLVDVRVTLGLPLDGIAPSPQPSLRPAADEDVPTLGTIASHSHRDGRFHADPRFNDAYSDDLYRIWIERSCRDGFADEVWLSGPTGDPTGYISTRYGDSVGSIELIAVDEKARGQGVGRSLVQQAISRFVEEGLVSASVVTQGKNTGALRLYEAAGFTLTKIEMWFHVWR